MIFKIFKNDFCIVPCYEIIEKLSLYSDLLKLSDYQKFSRDADKLLQFLYDIYDISVMICMKITILFYLKLLNEK
jgi:hypothetical protein